jgi:hypothetical protein
MQLCARQGVSARQAGDVTVHLAADRQNQKPLAFREDPGRIVAQRQVGIESRFIRVSHSRFSFAAPNSG